MTFRLWNNFPIWSSRATSSWSGRNHEAHRYFHARTRPWCKMYKGRAKEAWIWYVDPLFYTCGWFYNTHQDFNRRKSESGRTNEGETLGNCSGYRRWLLFANYRSPMSDRASSEQTVTLIVSSLQLLFRRFLYSHIFNCDSTPLSFNHTAVIKVLFYPSNPAICIQVPIDVMASSPGT